MISERQERRRDGGAAGQEWQDMFLCVQWGLIPVWMAAVEDITVDADQGTTIAQTKREGLGIAVAI